MAEKNITDWRLIEQDIETLERTGCWPAGDPPAWAQEYINQYPVKLHAADASIIDHGLREIIRQLKQDLWYARNIQHLSTLDKLSEKL